MNKKIDKTIRDNRKVVSNSFKESLKVNRENEGKRIDYYLSNSLGLSRSFIQKMIKEGNISIDRVTRVKPSRKIKYGEILNVSIPEPESMDIVPEPVDFKVVYEDEHLLVVDKPAGIVVHPAPGHWKGTLVHGLLYKYPDIGNINNVIRPGIVHRLDSTTSGLIIIARTSEAMISLQKSFKERTVYKEYLALSEGQRLSSNRLRVNVPIGRDLKNRYRMAVNADGKDSVTDFEVIWSRGAFSFLKCLLHTGRTHQIRVHLRYCGAPLVGDKLYGFKGAHKNLLEDRVFLHSWKLKLRHPVTGEKLSFISHLPSELLETLKEVISITGA